MGNPIVYAVLYFIVVIGFSTYYIRGKIKSKEDFVSGGNLNWVMIAAGLALIPLGSGHTMSLWEASAGLGASVLFWGIIVGGIFVPLLTLWFGPWIRELGVSTFPESMEALFGRKMGYLHACVNIGAFTGICMGETLASGGAIYGLTGGKVPYFPWCIIIAYILIMVYVVFGGVMQYAIVSVINATVMIVGSYIAVLLVGGWIVINAGGWQGIFQEYTTQNLGWKLELFRFSPDLLFQIIIPVSVLHIAGVAVAQGPYIPMLAAKSTEEVRKATFLATCINGLASFPWVIMALIAMAIPMFAAGGAKLSVINMALHTLPSPIVGLLMVCLLCATLSTGSSFLLGNTTVIIEMIFKRACYPEMKPETEYKLMRPVLLITGLMACVPALFVPLIFPVFLWCFSFGIPIFFMWIIGMTWKASPTAAWITVVVSYAVNFIWTFATPTWAPGPFALNMYPVTVISLVLGIILTAVLPGKSGLLKRVRGGEKIELAA